MVGILDDERAGRPIAFEAADHDIVLLGETRDELGGSEYAQRFHPDALVAPPRVDLAREKALIELLLALDSHKLIRTAHDLANGGLAVALVESSVDGIGCHIELAGHADDLDAIALLFSESQGRALVSCKPEHLEDVLRHARKHGVPAMPIGRTRVATFLIERNGIPLIRTSTPELFRIWRSAFALLLGGDNLEEVIRGVGEEVSSVLGAES